MMQKIPFHVPPDASPTSLKALLTVIDGECKPISRPALLARMAPYAAARPRGEAITLAQNLGIVINESNGVVGTRRSHALAHLDCRVDLIHGLQYFAWNDRAPHILTPMWTYRTIIDLIWDEAPVQVTASLKKRMVEEVLERAKVAFASVQGFDSARVSVGPKTVDGVMRWLTELSPPVIK